MAAHVDPRLARYMDEHRARVQQVLDACLPGAQDEPRRLHEAMRYAVLNGGKRVRAVLVYAAGQALGVPAGRLDAPAGAVELVHAYSLVHDDLPAMDDDDLRRGHPTCHRAFDEATAILAGDALQTLAFQVLAAPADGVGDRERLAMLAALAHATGSLGMAGGQALDLEAVGKQLDLESLERMHLRKTGALIRASVRLGALACAEVDSARLAALDDYARCVGLAFQIRDDILDVEGDTAVLGKQQGADMARNKPTYPSLLGMERAKGLADELHERAIASIAELPDAAGPLRWLSAFIVSRGQ